MTLEQYEKLRILEMISMRTEHAIHDNPNSKVAQDLNWLCMELRKAWLELEKAKK